MEKVLSLLLCLTFLYSVTLSGKNREVIVKLKDSSVINGEIVKLKDIGMVIGDNRLNNLTLVKFSSQSDSFLINRQLVLNEIVNFYKKIKEPVPEVRIFSKPSVTIKRKCFVITRKTISSIITDFLKANEQKIFRGRKWRILKIIAQNKIKLTTGKVDIKVSLTSEKNFYRLPFIVELFDGNRKRIKSLRAYAIVEVKEPVVVAAKNIFMRKVILPNMVKIAEVPIKNNNINFIKSLKEVVGKISKRYIREGEPIYRDIVQQPPMVKRGEIVNVLAQSSGISINTKGKVLENGYYNKSVRVQNLTSGKVFTAIVKGYGQVTVTF